MSIKGRRDADDRDPLGRLSVVGVPLLDEQLYRELLNRLDARRTRRAG
jgi:hypothetical protein